MKALSFLLRVVALYASGNLALWTYSFQTFSVLEVLGAAKMNQIEVNVRDHVHGQDSVSWVLGAGSRPGLANASVVQALAGGALTLSLKTNSGSDPSATNPVPVFFPNSDASISALNEVRVVTALSLTVNSGNSFGHASGKVQNLFPYLALTASGTTIMAVSNLPPTHPAMFDTGRKVTTFPVGSATSAGSVYAASSMTNLPWVPLAMCKTNQASAGVWVTSLTQVDVHPFVVPACVFHSVKSQTQAISVTTWTKSTLGVKEFDYDSTFDTTNSRHQPNVAGVYHYHGSFNFADQLTGGGQAAIAIYKNGNLAKFHYWSPVGNGAEGQEVTASVLMNGADDYVELYIYQGTSGSKNSGATGDGNFLTGWRVR